MSGHSGLVPDLRRTDFDWGMRKVETDWLLGRASIE